MSKYEKMLSIIEADSSIMKDYENLKIGRKELNHLLGGNRKEVHYFINKYTPTSNEKREENERFYKSEVEGFINHGIPIEYIVEENPLFDGLESTDSIRRKIDRWIHQFEITLFLRPINHKNFLKIVKRIAIEKRIEHDENKFFTVNLRQVARDFDVSYSHVSKVSQIMEGQLMPNHSDSHDDLLMAIRKVYNAYEMILNDDYEQPCIMYGYNDYTIQLVKRIMREIDFLYITQ